MEPLSAIMTAIISGAVASAKPTTEKVITDLYDGLKALIQRKYDVPLAAVEKKPDSSAQKAALQEVLQDANADKDHELLQQAQALLKAISEQAPQVAQAIGLKLEDIKAANMILEDISASGEQAAGVAAKNIQLDGDFKASGIKAEATKK